MRGFSRSLWIVLGVGVVLVLFFVWRNAENPARKTAESPNQTDKPTAPLAIPDKEEKSGTDASASFDSTTFSLPLGSKGQVVDNGCYTICYVEAFEQPSWTSYVLDGRPMMKIKRDDHRFQEDKAITTGSAELGDYRNSGYDRGHLVPAADMKRSSDCYEKSFLLSNISPQNHEFNTGLWRRLEESVRKWAKKKVPIQIVSGPILKKGLKKSIGKETKIPVPEEYYKVIVHRGPKGYQAVGFLMPNKDSDLSVEKFAVSVAQVEQRTGLDFNSALADSLEKSVENNYDLKYWFN